LGVEDAVDEILLPNDGTLADAVNVSGTVVIANGLTNVQVVAFVAEFHAVDLLDPFRLLVDGWVEVTRRADRSLQR